MKCNLFLLAVLLAPACNTSSHKPEHEVDKGMVAHLSESDQKAVRDAQTEEAMTRDQLSACKAATEQCKGELKVAKQELEVANAEVKKTELALKAAESGTTEDLEKAKAAHDQALTLPAAARSRIAFRERQIERADAREKLASERVNLAVARVELERAKAVRGLDRPDAKQIDLAKYETTERRAQEAVAVAKVKLDAARKETEIARKDYDARVEAIPAAYRETWHADLAENRTKEVLDLEEQMLK